MTSRPIPIASPFQRLAALLSGVTPGLPPIDLTIGEPRHPVPDFVAPTLAGSIADFGRYPPIKGTAAFRQAVADWLTRRYGLATPVDPEAGVLPLNGSREGLFFAALQAVRRRGAGTDRPAILLPNPFYQVYAAAAEAAGAEAVLLPAGPETGFLPDLAALDPALLARTAAVFYASPANPQGAVASLATWRELIGLARTHGFYVFADECYSEIWRGAPPAGVLEAADAIGDGFGKVVSFNSLSKRSNLPGLRCGFAAGDADFLAEWAVFRNVAAPQVPLPVQAVAVAAFADEAHVAENRRLYDLKFAGAQARLAPLFGSVTPPGGFFLWLDVSRWGGGEAVTRRLFAEAGVKVLPGGTLAAETFDPETGDPETGDPGAGRNPGADYIRIAMVEAPDRTDEALARLTGVLT
ncbi:aminotransferase class I/II-fold pyridoxal phosphate-dependent enzyme [Chthonobacter rhizosphaerae]|uniref:aminotransferase class I/II-fold pyridoxal phosphate-dependent enzyme n=1 Tax=Chthonobacter rhizosphaerae TaxID=2735553 RepID=UPI0015EF1C74|nr:aminotransferase class I/II-fold pyridoxal phosphate-dependent enzyme [Chthonobacter rhizosphaerae]